MPGETRYTNRLAEETSPYLLQHAHNPVDWYPWSAEALERARAEDRPIFLSIGYAACHWCHVMERESFEDEMTASLLNANFVAIKVDREERPDLDAIYMDAVQHMTGQGGWPMSVFLTPEGKPFYGGTYFPNQARYGMPSFKDVLNGVAEAWRTRRAELEQAGSNLAAALSTSIRRAGNARTPGSAAEEWMLDAALVSLEREFDARNGGWGGAPKFPQPMTVEFLLRLHKRTGDARPLAMARHTLDRMAAGGIYDHLGGGFARYATDSVWLVPHFEKMLYDNAQLARVYLHAWELTRDQRYAQVVDETLGFVARELTTAEGGFASSLDADTNGEEGATYVWSKTEIEDTLGPDSRPFIEAYGVTANGNWEGTNILSRVVRERLDEDALSRSRARLLDVRAKRPQPARDEKVLTAWNGLMIAAFAEAGAAMRRPEWIASAERAADLLLRVALDADGRLRRSFKDGRALHAAVLEDYANLADGLLALYEATFDERWFTAARALADQALLHFTDPAGGFFDTADDHEDLITRPKGLQDNAVPSGNSMMTNVLLGLAAFTGDARYRDAAERSLEQVTQVVSRYPTAFGQWLSAMTFALGDVTEIAVVGDPDAAATRALIDVVRGEYRPFSVIAAAGTNRADISPVPLLRDRPQIDGKPTAYVCRGFACRAPVTEPAELASQLASAT